MSKIERRRRVVSLHHGNYEAELAALLDKTMAAQRAEASDGAAGAPRRAGQRSDQKESVALASRYDALLTEAEESAVKVPVWAITHDEWSQLADEHPPRDDLPEDKENGVAARVFQDDKDRGVNAKTFPPQLLRAALVDPSVHVDGDTSEERLTNRIAMGDKILADLGLSRIHYVKLETAAWNVNVGDDALPKFSLVLFLKQGSEDDSKQPSDSA